MRRYFFHLATPSGYERDEIGSRFAAVEAAYIGACQAAMEISVDLLKRRQDPAGHRFEIFDEQNQLVLELPFAEVLGARRAAPAGCRDSLQTQVASRIERGRELQAQLADGLAEAQRTLKATRDLLSRAPRPPAA